MNTTRCWFHKKLARCWMRRNHPIFCTREREKEADGRPSQHNAWKRKRSRRDCIEPTPVKQYKHFGLERGECPVGPDCSAGPSGHTSLIVEHKSKAKKRTAGYKGIHRFKYNTIIVCPRAESR